MTGEQFGWHRCAMEGNVIRPENVMLQRDHLPQQSKRFCWSDSFRDDLRIR